MLPMDSHFLCHENSVEVFAMKGLQHFMFTLEQSNE